MQCADRQGWAARSEHPSQLVWVMSSPQDTDTPCCLPSMEPRAAHLAFLKPFALASLSCLPTAPRQGLGQPAPRDKQPLVTANPRGQPDEYGQSFIALGRAAGSFCIPQSCCQCSSSLCSWAALVGSHQPPACVWCWAEGSGCVRHICIQIEPGFTSLPWLTVLVLAGSPSSRPGKER